MALTERTFRFSFWFLLIAGILLFLSAPVIPILYGHKFAPSISPFKILLIGTIAYGSTGILTQFFTDQLGKVRYPLYMQGVSVATNLTISWLLIPRLGMDGGAIASSTAYVVALFMSCAYYKMQTRRPLRHLFAFRAEDVAILRRLVARH